MADLNLGEWQEAPRPLSKDGWLFAVGDIHAHLDQLECLSAFIRKEASATGEGARATVVWLGDYIDRGPQPLECLDHVAAGLSLPAVREVALRGNHEQFLLDFVDHPLPSQHWLQVWTMNGGRDTLEALLPGETELPLESLADRLRQKLGDARLSYLRGLPLSHRWGDYFFAHAGVNPHKSLESQGEDDLLWIREPFLSGKDWPHPVVVVHGHTPEGPRCLPHRIGVDSGVFYSGELTAVELKGAQMRFITAAGVAHKGKSSFLGRLMGAMFR